jgi:hypothetical protein
MLSKLSIIAKKILIYIGIFFVCKFEKKIKNGGMVE